VNGSGVETSLRIWEEAGIIAGATEEKSLIGWFGEWVAVLRLIG